MVKCKSAEFDWLGSAELTSRVCMASPSSGVSKAQDLFGKELAAAESG